MHIPKVRRIFSKRDLHQLALLTAVVLSGSAGQLVPMQTIDKVGTKKILAPERIQFISDDMTSTRRLISVDISLFSIFGLLVVVGRGIVCDALASPHKTRLSVYLQQLWFD
jgi:hypothetical protein